MREITIDWATTSSVDQFFDSMTAELGMEVEAVHNVAALEQAVLSSVSTLQPPYRVDIVNLNKAGTDVVDFAMSVSAVFSDACHVHDDVIVCFYNNESHRPVTL